MAFIGMKLLQTFVPAVVATADARILFIKQVRTAHGCDKNKSLACEWSESVMDFNVLGLMIVLR